MKQRDRLMQDVLFFVKDLVFGTKFRLQTTKAVLVTAFDSQYNEAVEANGAQTTDELRIYKSGE